MTHKRQRIILVLCVAICAYIIVLQVSIRGQMVRLRANLYEAIATADYLRFELKNKTDLLTEMEGELITSINGLNDCQDNLRYAKKRGERYGKTEKSKKERY